MTKEDVKRIITDEFKKHNEPLKQVTVQKVLGALITAVQSSLTGELSESMIRLQVMNAIFEERAIGLRPKKSFLLKE